MKLFKQIETSFENFDNTIRAYLTKAFNNLGQQYSHSQIFGVIFDGIKGVMQNIMFYIEDALSEQNIYTASRKKSIYSLAKLSGYDPYYGSAASGNVLLKVGVNNTANIDPKIFIYNYCRIRNTSTNLVYSLFFSTNSYLIDLNKPIIQHNVTILQGFFAKNEYIAKGDALETIHITSIELFDKNYIKVEVDGKEWNDVGNLYDMIENGEQYIISSGYDNSFDIMFGNGVYGKKLELGQTVSITYLKHTGSAGNILPNENAKFKFIDKGYDTLGNSVNLNNYIDIKLNTTVSGGTQSDTIGFVRKMIGYNSRSLVLASNDSFKLFFKRFSFIGYVNCWSEHHSMIINATCIRNFKNELTNIEDYCTMNINDMLLTDLQKNMVIDTLENSRKSFAGISLNFKDPLIRKYAIIAYIKVNDAYSKEIVKQNVTKSLIEYFMSNIEDNKFISKSSLIKMLHDSNDSIDSIDIDIISDIDQQAKYSGFYETYELRLIDGAYQHVLVKKYYDESEKIGLDEIGNIRLKNEFEFPVLHKSKYCIVGESNSIVDVDPIQIYFLN